MQVKRHNQSYSLERFVDMKNNMYLCTNKRKKYREKDKEE